LLEWGCFWALENQIEDETQIAKSNLSRTESLIIKVKWDRVRFDLRFESSSIRCEINFLFNNSVRLLKHKKTFMQILIKKKRVLKAHL